MSYLVTGANSGIGLELVTQLSALPTSKVTRVFALVRRSSEALDALPSDRVTTIIISNLADAAEVSKAVASATEKLDGKGLDVLINNAGAMEPTGGKFEPTQKTQDMSAQELMSTLESNVATSLVVTSSFLPLLKQGKQKKIFNITTCGAFHAYKISKAAMNMLNQQFAGELEAEGFCVALITPGWLKSRHPQADLEVSVGVKAVLDIVFGAGPEQNGKFLNIRVAGWEENTKGPNKYDGKEIPW
ncbi:C-factor [Cyphellophora attinorum]|uniref:C-factor n=1 Tax=Cyphellophora attinorum TaxID=1664694 RepID=A0A0N0NJT6_9EURO|nr:C-factor [Phialophora attinorum]KPI37268.1 C-factor [Phialophora attinorum]